MYFYGINPITESLRSSHLPQRIFIARHKKNPGIEQIRQLAERRQIPVEKVEDPARICNAREHQGVCAEIDETCLVTYLTEDQLNAPRIVMLDGIQDPHNFGASLRVCEGFGFHTVIFQKGNSSGLTPAAIKTSAGAAFHLNLICCRLNTAMHRLQEADIPVFALDGSGDSDIYTIALPPRFCVVVGSESKGVRFSVRRQAQGVLKIPMFGKVNSLNLSCALTAALTEFSRRAP